MSTSRKVLSIIVGLFLFLAAIDNVPDCPELVTKRTCASASIQIVGITPAADPFVYRQPLVSRVFNIRPSDLVEAIEPSSLPPYLQNATDPSPPAA